MKQADFEAYFRAQIASWCNGSTRDSGSLCLGSNPSEAVKAGNLFVAEFVSGRIFKITPEGAQSTFVSGLDGPNAIAFDSSGNLWEAEYFAKRIVRYNSNGTSTEFIGFMDLGPFGLAIEPMPHALLNISTRGFVGTGDAVLIGGFIVGGNGLLSGKVLIRAAGPSMTAAGVAGTLQDPVLRLFNSSGAVIASNNNWKDTQQALIQATALAPTDDRESAIVASLPAGAYTAIITGSGNMTGIAPGRCFQLAVTLTSSGVWWVMPKCYLGKVLGNHRRQAQRCGLDLGLLQRCHTARLSLGGRCLLRRWATLYCRICAATRAAISIETEPMRASFSSGFTAAFPRRVFERQDPHVKGPRLDRVLKVPA